MQGRTLGGGGGVWGSDTPVFVKYVQKVGPETSMGPK